MHRRAIPLLVVLLAGCGPRTPVDGPAAPGPAATEPSDTEPSDTEPSDTEPTDTAAADLAVVGATVIADPSAPALADATVLVRDGRVVAMGERSRIDVPTGTQVVDAAGKWVIPGLWDMHVHLTYATELAMPVLLANGVTGVRDMGGDLAWLRELEDRRAAGEVTGPRVFMAGPVVDGPKPGAPHRITVETAAEGRAAADSIHAAGTGFIKVHNGVPPEAYFALLDRAAELGIPVAGHVPLRVRPAAAVRAGHEGVEHFVTIYEGTLARELEGIEGMAQYAETELDTLARAFGASGAYLTPTAYVYLVRARRGELQEDRDPRLRYVARSLQERWDEWFPIRDVDRDPRTAEVRERFYRIGLQTVAALHDHGVPILAGTDLTARDALPGFHLHDELESLVQAGLTPAEALAAATTTPARVLRADTLGGIAVGHRADFVILDADPREDIGNTRRIVAVVADGRFYDRAALDALLAEAAARAEQS